LNNVKDRLLDVENTIEKFEYENWKYVVPELIKDIENLRYEIENLEEQVSESYPD